MIEKRWDRAQNSRGTVSQSTRKEEFIGQNCLGKESIVFKMQALAWHVTKLASYTIGSMWKFSKCTTLKFNYKQAQPLGDHN